MCWGFADCELLTWVYRRVLNEPERQKALFNALFASDSFFVFIHRWKPGRNANKKFQIDKREF